MTLRVTALLGLLALIAAGCEERQVSSSGPDTGLRVKDGLGRAVRLPGPARRIAALSPSNVEILFAVGCGERVVLRDRVADFPAAVKALPATSAFHLAPEHIAGFRPDLVLMSRLDPSRMGALAALHIPVAVFDSPTVDAVFSDMLVVGRLCGAEARARSLVKNLRGALDSVRRQVAGRPRPRVYIELDGSDALKPWTAGARSLVADAVRLAGGTNVFADLPRTAVQVSAEAVYQRSPDVVLLAGGQGRSRRALVERPTWGRLPAVKAGRIIDDVDPAPLSRPGPRIVLGVEALARRLHSDHLTLDHGR